MIRRELDRVYFSNRRWDERVEDWVRLHDRGDDESFLGGNLAVVREVLSDEETGLRMVINIGPDALLSFLITNDYKNIYEKPVIGGKQRTPTQERQDVDTLLGFGPQAQDFYFGAVALGGGGVRYYGAHCMVLKASEVPPDTRLFDRDSYDLLQSPLSGWDQQRTQEIADQLRGTWSKDVVEMLIMKMLPKLPDTQHLITAGSLSALVIADQEFVEVHRSGKIYREHLEEVRDAPEEVAVEMTILNRKRSGQSPTAVEIRWVAQRHKVLQALARNRIAHRVVTLHGAGYQWR
jgi:hypothetical protein